ncbi:MAG: ATP-binding protein [Victivallales bacterium]
MRKGTENDFLPVLPAAVIRGAAEECRSMAEAAGIDLVVGERSSIEFPGDSLLLQQALNNLITNAVLHSGTKRIEVSAVAAEGKHIDFLVRDYGCGIAAGTPGTDLQALLSDSRQPEAGRATESGWPSSSTSHSITAETFRSFPNRTRVRSSISGFRTERRRRGAGPVSHSRIVGEKSIFRQDSVKVVATAFHHVIFTEKHV